MWGTLGLVYNASKITNKSDMTSWSSLWSDSYRNKFSIKNSMRDTYFIGLAKHFKTTLDQAKIRYDLGEITLDEYKTISAVISLPQDELEKIPGLGTNSAASLRMFFECMRYCLAEQCCDRVLLPTSEELRNFVRMKLGVRHHECYMAVFLNSRNYLISYHVVAEGTVDNVLNYSRNVVEMALRKGACKMLLVHNHPSGVCAPSNDDIAATGECYWTLAAMGIELIDHLIVTPTECFSFQDNGLDLNCSFKGQNNER